MVHGQGITSEGRSCGIGGGANLKDEEGLGRGEGSLAREASEGEVGVARERRREEGS